MTSLRFSASVWSIGFIALAACGANDPGARLEDLGLACDSTHACPAGTECGTCGIGAGQCIAPCEVSGTDGCPAGAYCTEAFTDKTTHICVRQCTSGNDIDCKTPVGNQALSCNDPYTESGVHHDDIFVCGTEDGATTCP